MKIVDFLEDLTGDIKFNTCGDHDEELVELNDKLHIIRKYFPFKTVVGRCDNETDFDLNFDDRMFLYGDFKEEPFNAAFVINDIEYELNFHPFDTMGGFFEEEFEKGVKRVHDEVNKITDAERYADKLQGVLSESIAKIKELNGTAIFLVAIPTGEINQNGDPEIVHLSVQVGKAEMAVPMVAEEICGNDRFKQVIFKSVLMSDMMVKEVRG